MPPRGATAWRNLPRGATAVLLYAAGWYCVSISVTFTNKYLLSDRHFDLPFTLATVTNSFVSLFAWLATRRPRWRPDPLPWSTIVTTVVPIGSLTALDIGCSNWALVHLSIAFHTIVRGTIPAFVLCFSIVLGLTPPSWYVGCSVLVVCVGVGLAAYGELACDAFGLTMAILSCVFSGLRWALTQVLVQSGGDGGSSMGTQLATCSKAGGSTGMGGGEGSSCDRGDGGSEVGADGGGGSDAATRAFGGHHRSPLASIYYTAPACAACSAAGALLLERRALLLEPSVDLAFVREELLWFNVLLASLVFTLLFCEFGLVRLTSSLALSLLGVVKELITICLAAGARGDVITPTNLSGFFLCATGGVAFALLRARAAVGADASGADGGGGRAGRPCLAASAQHTSTLSRAAGPPPERTSPRALGLQEAKESDACLAMLSDDDGERSGLLGRRL